MGEVDVLVIKEICHFIKTKCSLMNEGNFKDLSEMIISDVSRIENKLQQLTVSESVCECKNLPKGEYAISSKALSDPNWTDG